MAKKKKFKRTSFGNYSKLGVRRKKKQKYRKGKGIDNKMRLKIKGHLRKIEIGFKGNKKTSGLVKGLKPVIINNIEDLKKITKSEIGIVAKIGNKKRKEIAEYVIKNNIKLSANPKKMLEKIENKLKKVKQEKDKRKEKKTEKDKKAKKEAEKKAKQEAKAEKKEMQGSEDKKIESKKEEVEKTNKPSKDTDKNEKTESKKEIQTNNYGRGK